MRIKINNEMKASDGYDMTYRYEMHFMLGTESKIKLNTLSEGYNSQFS